MSVFFYFCRNSFFMIVIIGAEGFLGSRMVAKLQKARDAAVIPFSDTDDFFRFLPVHYHEVEWVVYCDKRIPNEAASVFRHEYVQKLWTLSSRYSLPLLYAFHQPMESPESDFCPDRFVLWSGRQYQKPPFWYIFRVGEVYGNHEDVAGESTSRIDAFCRQIVLTGEAILPLSAKEEQGSPFSRDYLYVQDAVRVFYWFMCHHPANGVYDLGSGFERTDLAVVNAIFRALKREPQIRYEASSPVASDTSATPFLPDLRSLRRVGYKKAFYSVEQGVKSSFRDMRQKDT